MTRARRDCRRRPDRGRRRAGVPSQDGFILLESIMAISLILVILAGLGGFTLRAINASGQLRARQGATQVATSAMNAIDAVPATDLLTGRDSTSVASQWNAAVASGNTQVTAALAKLSQTDDGSMAGSGATATISTSPQTTTLNNVAYTVNTYVGTCKRSTSTGQCSTANSSGVSYLGVVVAVTWANRGCGAGSSGCTYVSTTLVNTDDDPVFSSNATTSANPEINDPGNQVSTIGGAVSLQLAVASGTGTGTTSQSWSVTSGTLPSGLSMSSAGLISGTPTALRSASSLTIMVTDGFGRTDTTTFTWAVVAAPTIATPAAQKARAGVATSLTPTYTCPNTPCTFALANGPAGLSIDASSGVISGTPTTAQTYANVTITVTDASSVAATTSAFTWTVLAKPAIADPGTKAMTVGQAYVSAAYSYSCPTSTCTVSLSNTVPGVGLSTSNTTPTASNTTVSLTVSKTSTVFYVTGVVQSTAVGSASSKAYAPVFTITDTDSYATTSATGSWTAYAKPTIGTIGSYSVKVGASGGFELSYTCPTANCTVVITNPVTGLGLSSAITSSSNNVTSLSVSSTSGKIYFGGKVASSAVTSGNSTAYGMTLTITDSNGVAGAIDSGTWTATK